MRSVAGNGCLWDGVAGGGEGTGGGESTGKETSGEGELVVEADAFVISRSSRCASVGWGCCD